MFRVKIDDFTSLQSCAILPSKMAREWVGVKPKISQHDVIWVPKVCLRTEVVRRFRARRHVKRVRFSRLFADIKRSRGRRNGKEEDDNAHVIFSQMELYQDFTSSGEGNGVDEEAD